MAKKMEFHTEWAIPEDSDDREIAPDESQRQLALTAAASGTDTQPQEKWRVVEA